MSEEIFELSTDDGDDDALNLPGLASDGVPGLLVSVEFDDNLSDPIVENGKVRMPKSATQQYAAFSKDENGATSVTPGWLCGMDITETVNRPEAEHGVVKFPLAQTSGTAIEGGSSVGSSVSSTGSSENTPGAIAGIQFDDSIPYPIIDKGVIKIPMTGDSMLQGVYDINNVLHKWVDVQNYVGSQIPVAFTNLDVNGNYVLPLLLSIGFDGAGLRFYLSNTNPV